MGAELAMDPRRWMRTGVAVVLTVKLAGLLPLAALAVGGGDGGSARSASTPAVTRAAKPSTGAGAAAPAGIAPKAAPPASEPLRIPGDRPSAEFDAESRGVRELVEVLRRRDEELARRDAELARREAAIAAAAKDLNDKIVHLESLTGSTASVAVPAGSPAQPGGQPPGAAAAGHTPDASSGGAAVDAMEELGKIYGAMKAEEAAPLFDRLDDATVLRIFQHMKQRQISAVLPLMKPEKAVVLTELLGGRKPSRPASPAASR